MLDIHPWKIALPLVFLALLWCWETWRPFLGQEQGRLRHALHNLAIAVFNTLVLGLAFGAVTVLSAGWTAEQQLGLLNAFDFPGPLRFILALVLLDGWMYLWHRANHAIPLLWRFHRMHHSDRHMDVTTATRFHLGEHVAGATLRLGVICILGLEVWNLIVYEMLVVAITQFHHADISLGRIDRWLRLVIVTPDMHKVHHSDWQPETDSNFSTVLSIWDRLARTFRLRSDPRGIVFGLDDFRESCWQIWWGMLKTPFVSRSKPVEPAVSDTAEDEQHTLTGTTA